MKRLWDKGLPLDEKILKYQEVIIINSFGILPAYFKFAKSVFMGKSILKKFESEGGQNPIEAVRFGCKIYHGPYIYNFEEIYKTLEKNGISKKIVEQSLKKKIHVITANKSLISKHGEYCLLYTSDAADE